MQKKSCTQKNEQMYAKSRSSAKQCLLKASGAGRILMSPSWNSSFGIDKWKNIVSRKHEEKHLNDFPFFFFYRELSIISQSFYINLF